MQSTLLRKPVIEHEVAFRKVELPNFSRQARFNSVPRALSAVHLAEKAPGLIRITQEAAADRFMVPDMVPSAARRYAPIIVRINRMLRTSLVALCGVCILGYGLDVAASSEVGRLQEQARRINEQNSELSAQLLKAISFQGIQASVLGQCGLRVPEQVLIVKEEPAPAPKSFKPNQHQLPIMSGF